MTCKVTASREAFTTGRAREGLGRAGVCRGASTMLLALLIRHLLLLLGIGVVGGVWNVVVVVEHGHGRCAAYRDESEGWGDTPRSEPVSDLMWPPFM
jgi:hypothetical protein